MSYSEHNITEDGLSGREHRHSYLCMGDQRNAFQWSGFQQSGIQGGEWQSLAFCQLQIGRVVHGQPILLA